MAGTNITVQLDLADADRSLQKLDAGLAQPKQLLASIGEQLLRSTKDRFKTQAAPDGTPWPALSRRYAKRKKYNKDRVLTLRGYLRNSIAYQPDGDDAVQVGTNRVYAAIHQLGGSIDMPARQSAIYLHRNARGKIGRRFVKKSRANVQRDVTIGAHQVNIPARRFLGLSATDRVEIAARTQAWLRGML